MELQSAGQKLALSTHRVYCAFWAWVFSPALWFMEQFTDTPMFRNLYADLVSQEDRITLRLIK